MITRQKEEPADFVALSADEEGSTHAFGGALLAVENDKSDPPECAVDSLSDSPIPDERGPDSWRQLDFPQTVQAGFAGNTVAPQTQAGITLHTIWARLLQGYQANSTASTAGRKSGSESGSGHSPASSDQPVASSASTASALSDVGLAGYSNKLCALLCPQTVSRLLEIPRSGRCCVCGYLWTEDQRKRALAVERVVEATFSRFEELEIDSDSPSEDSLLEPLGGIESPKRLEFEGDEAQCESQIFRVNYSCVLRVGSLIRSTQSTKMT